MAMIRPETEMKDSGVQWLGNVPKEWSVGKVKHEFYATKTIVGDKVNDYERLALTLNGVIKRSKDAGDGLQPEKFDGYQILKEHELVFKLIDLANVSTSRVGLSPYTGIVSPAYIVLHHRKDMNPRYGEYYFLSMWMNEVFNHIGGDGVRSALNAKDLLNIPYLKVSSDEQQAIADYLDETCSKIDEIIAEAKASIDEYKTFKQALITEITTNGLNKNIDFCETNFAWMGKIPSHWELKPFKYILNERNEKNNPIKSTERLSLSIDKGITLYAEKTTNLDRFKDDFTAYKLAYKGDLVMNSMNMIVGASGVSDYFGCVSPVYYTYFDNEPDHITAKYCEYLFRSRMLMRVLRSLGRGIHHIDRGDDRVNTCRLKVSRDDLRTLVLPVPPLCEQRDIVSFLDKRTTEIDSLISEKESLINDLEAYKKSLIYEVVTGKRRVV